MVSLRAKAALISGYSDECGRFEALRRECEDQESSCGVLCRRDEVESPWNGVRRVLGILVEAQQGQR